MSASSENWHAKLRVTVEDYHRLGEVGALVLGPRVELIDGEIVDMPPVGRRYAAVVERLVPRSSLRSRIEPSSGSTVPCASAIAPSRNRISRC